MAERKRQPTFFSEVCGERGGVGASTAVFRDRKSSRKMRHELIRLLGQGAYGTVGLYNHAEFGRVAGKLVDSAKVSLTTRREYTILTNLRCTPGIVQVLGKSDVEHSKTIIFTELLEGGDLSRAMATLSLANHVKQSLAVQMICAVAHMHQHKVAHRDIKPANMCLTNRGCLKLVDFGLSRKEMSTESQKTYSYSGDVVSLWWQAPEILVSCANRPWPYNPLLIDVWSLCAVMLELYLGENILSGSCGWEVLSKICRLIGLPSYNGTRSVLPPDSIKTLPMWHACRISETVDRLPRWTQVILKKGLRYACDRSNSRDLADVLTAEGVSLAIISLDGVDQREKTVMCPPDRRALLAGAMSPGAGGSLDAGDAPKRPLDEEEDLFGSDDDEDDDGFKAMPKAAQSTLLMVFGETSSRPTASSCSSHQKERMKLLDSTQQSQCKPASSLKSSTFGFELPPHLKVVD